MNNSDSATFIGKKGKIMQNAETQMGNYEENIFPEEKEIQSDKIIKLNDSQNNNNEEEELNEYQDELNNFNADNIIANEEDDYNLNENENENEKENENEQNQEDNNNNGNIDNNNFNSMNYSQMNLIKSHLKLICDKIEEGLNNYHKSKETSRNDTSFQNSFSNIEIKPLTKELNNYKQQSENLQFELENVYNIQKVNELESELQKKRNFYQKLKKDNNTLKKVVREQSKGIDEYISKFDNTKEIDEIKEKLKEERKELKIKKDNNKNIEVRIKNQNNKIDALEKRSKLIKENIDYCKKKQMKDLKKNEEENEEKIEEGDINKLIEEKKKLETENINKEKQYKLEIKHQNLIIKDIKQQISIISNKLKEIEQIKKMEELKKKEIQRNKIKQIQKSKSPIRINNNINNQRKYDRTKNMSRDNIRRFNDNIKSNINPNNKNKINYNNPLIEDIMLTRTPNLKVKGGKFNKPFEINKFNKGPNVTNYIPKRLSQALPDNPNDIFKRKEKDDIPELGSDNNNKKDINRENVKTPNIVINEIENLKNEIQNALKNDIFKDNNPIPDKNIYIKDNENENTHNRVNSNDKNYKFNEQSTIIATPINDISDIRNDFEYLNELENQNIIPKNLPKERIPSSRRRPFDNINFK